MFPRWLKWPLFAAFIGLVLAICISTEMQEAKIYNQRQPAKAESGNSPTSKTVGNVATKPQNEIREPETQWYSELLKPTDWFLVIFNGLLVLYTRRLYKATSGLFTETAGLRSAADKQSADMQASIKAAVDSSRAAITSNQIAVSNAEQQLRAYVTARDVHLFLHREPSYMGAYGVVEGNVHTYALAAILHNGGQTPATNITINVSCQKLAKPLQNDFAFPDSDRFGYGVIGPQSEMHAPVSLIRERDIEPIEAAFDWYLWGWVEYNDIFEGTGPTPDRILFPDRSKALGSNQ